MKSTLNTLVLSLLLMASATLCGQEDNLSAIELSFDQDYLSEFLHDDPVEPFNYTAGLRLGFYGEAANHIYLGLPYVRQKIDWFFIERIMDNSMYRHENESHNFVLTINGFSPGMISDETQLFLDTTANGYQLINDLRFSSFTGFRSTKRIEYSKPRAHIAGISDLAVTTSFTFGFASIGLIRSIDNILTGDRPDGNLWKRDEDKPYPTGQLNYAPIPLFMYSMSLESVLLRPMRQVVLQMRPELNLGYYTDIGIGLDFGKVMNTEKFIDNLSYTDTNNPGSLSISDKNFAFAIAGGAVIRAVFYNAHYHGMFGFNKGEEFAWNDTQKYLAEGYVGLKMQFFRTIELNFSVNARTSALKTDDNKINTWGTVGLKYLIGRSGEGCYD